MLSQKLDGGVDRYLNIAIGMRGTDIGARPPSRKDKYAPVQHVISIGPLLLIPAVLAISVHVTIVFRGSSVEIKVPDRTVSEAFRPSPKAPDGIVDSGA